MNKTEKNETTKKSRLQILERADFGVEDVAMASPISFANYVRAQWQNPRQGTVDCQGRSDVSYTNAKPWKQKGTGRARAGSARSPLWRGGGVVHGPNPRIRTLKTNKKLRNGVLKSIFHSYLEQGRIVAADWEFTQGVPKSSAARAFLKNDSLLHEKITLFVAPGDVLTYASFVNFPNVSVLYFDQPNALDLTNTQKWVFLKKDAEHFKQMVSQWV